MPRQCNFNSCVNDATIDVVDTSTGYVDEHICLEHAIQSAAELAAMTEYIDVTTKKSALRVTVTVLEAA